MEFGPEFWWFVVVGLCAQLVDGALGMAFGLISSTVLLSLGLPPATVSASVHAAEVFTTGVSGASHLWMRNVDRRLFLRLAIPGVIGGVTGAYLLSQLDGDRIKPFVYAYLLVLGGLILFRSFGRFVPKEQQKRVPAIGLMAGLMDAIGGGGWGPIATSSLLAGGGKARTTIGTVNAAEFVVTLAISMTFLFTIGVQHLDVVLGMLVGGVIAAPLAAVLVKHMPERIVLTAVGVLVLCISLYQIGWVYGRAWLAAA